MSRTITAALATSRRRLLAGSGIAAALATGGLSAEAASVPAQLDPVVALYARYRAIEDEGAGVSERHNTMRAGFVQRHGDICFGDVSAYAAWKSDPLHAELDALRERSNTLCDTSTDLLDAMMATPATSVEGVRCKLAAALHVWRFIEAPGFDPDRIEYQDTLTVAFLRDAVRVLGGSPGA